MIFLNQMLYFQGLKAILLFFTILYYTIKFLLLQRFCKIKFNW